MCQWIVDYKTTYNIQMVLHEGDLTDNGGLAAQWTNADAGIDILDAANVPYLLAIGNHDYDIGQAVGADRAATNYNASFGQTRYTGKSWWNGGFYEASHAENAYNLVTINGAQYLFLSLEFGPRDAVLTWADGIIAANPNATVIVVTHSHMNNDGSLITTGDDAAPSGYTMGGSNNGDVVFSTLLDKYANISIVGSGHHVGGAHVSTLTSAGENGNIVNQFFANWQDLAGSLGGDGWLHLLTINPGLNTVRFQTYSPHQGTTRTDATHKFTWTYKAT